MSEAAPSDNGGSRLSADARVRAARALLPRLYDGEEITVDAYALAEEARAASDVAGECAALYSALAAASFDEDTEQVRSIAGTIVQRATHGQFPVWEAVGRQYLARLYLAGEQENLAFHEVIEAELLVDEAGDSLELAVALNGIAVAYSRLELYEDSERTYARLHEVAHTAGDRWSRVALVHNRLLNRASWSLALLRIGEERAAAERLTTAARQAREEVDVGGTPAQADIDALLLFTDLMTSAVSLEEARRRFAGLLDDAKGEAVGFARFGLAHRLMVDGRLDEAREEATSSLSTVHPVDGEPVHSMLRWLRARIALLADPGHSGLRDVGDYAELAARQVWQLRERRRDAARERLRIGRMRREHERVERAALEDPLTGVANRRRLDRERTALLDVDDTIWTTVVYLDIDHFKHINDEQGHAVGDAVLCELATILLRTTRSNDVVGRYGGDEFVLIAPDCDPDEAARLADRLLAAIRGHRRWSTGTGAEVTVSIGLATARGPNSRLFLAADEALYAAKANGRDRVEARVLATDLTVLSATE